jgi:hypothetical protein
MTDLLEAVRKALAATSPSIDVAAVELQTPLAALFFDSIRALAFISRLEADLGLGELPFEEWLQSHAERTDHLTIGALIDWLESLADG